MLKPIRSVQAKIAISFRGNPVLMRILLPILGGVLIGIAVTVILRLADGKIRL